MTIQEWKIYQRNRINPGLILFIILVGVGALTVKRYGMSWDENMQRTTGSINYDYIFYETDAFETWPDKDYGPAFEIVLIALENLFKAADVKEIFHMRHFATHVFFLIGAYFFYLLVFRLYRDKKLALFAMLLFVMHPRIYTHSFFNTKDIPFLAMFAVSLYFLVRAFQLKSVWNFIFLGISVGLLINLRILGIMLIASVPGFLAIDMILTKEWKRNTVMLLVFIVVSVLTLIATWPYLWNNPYRSFITAFANMSHFRWGGAVLLNGELVMATDLPWYYLPEWFIITTPIIYLVGGMVGLVCIAKAGIQSIKQIFTDGLLRFNFLWILLFGAPFVAVIALNSVVYDGWRQVFFTYVPFVLIVIFAIQQLKEFTWPRKLILIGIIYSLGALVFYFPYGNVYFNSTMDFRQHEYIRKHFETDYWGTSYLECLKYILENDDQDSIKIAVKNYPGLINQWLLDPVDRNRIQNVDEWDAQYFIADYRSNPEGFDRLEAFKYYEIKRGRNTISTVFKLR